MISTSSPSSASIVCGFASPSAESFAETSKASGVVSGTDGAAPASACSAALRTRVFGGATVTTSTIRPTSASTSRVIRRVITPYEVRRG